MVLLRVFNGGSGSVQFYPFTAAIGEISVQAGMNITVETLSICEVKDSNWSPVELVDWLLGSDAHFILSHVHQGKSSAGINQMGWNVNHLEEQLWRLANHNGFPSGVQLKCPIFLQNKIKYIRAVPQYTNPTLRVVLNKRGTYTTSRYSVHTFLVVFREIKNIWYVAR